METMRMRITADGSTATPISPVLTLKVDESLESNRWQVRDKQGRVLYDNYRDSEADVYWRGPAKSEPT